MAHIGLIGCGKMGRRHLEAYRSFDDYDVTVFDLNPEIAKQQAGRFGVSYAKYIDELFDSNSICAIDICTPTESHKDIAVKALASQKHVFCEKPLCASVEEAIEIGQAQEQSGLVVMVGYIYRFAPVFQFVKSVLDNRIIGQPYLSMMRIGGPGSHATWKHKRSEQGGVRLEKLVHLMDLAQWFFGGITCMTETLWQTTLFRERFIGNESVSVDAEDITLIRAEIDDVKVLIEADLTSSTYMNYVEIQGDKGSIFGSVLTDLPVIVFCHSERGTYKQGSNIFTFPYTNYLRPELRCFLGLIAGDTMSEYHSVDDSLFLLKALDAFRQEKILQRGDEHGRQ